MDRDFFKFDKFSFALKIKLKFEGKYLVKNVNHEGTENLKISELLVKAVLDFAVCLEVEEDEDGKIVINDVFFEKKNGEEMSLCESFVENDIFIIPENRRRSLNRSFGNVESLDIGFKSL